MRAKLKHRIVWKIGSASGHGNWFEGAHMKSVLEQVCQDMNRKWGNATHNVETADKNSKETDND